MNAPLLSVRDLGITFGDRGSSVDVVRGVSFDVARGETLAIVGESGSGKTVTALAVMGLLPEREALAGSGSIVLDGRDVLRLPAEERRLIRGARIGMVFQEPMTSLNPVLPIGRQMTEALEVHRGTGRRAAAGQAVAMLDRVGIADPAARLSQYPHEFSGGMRQRVMIAMAMLLEPPLLIADEPTTALDVTIQAQVLELMRSVTREMGASLLLITHDMGVVAEMADRVVVMRAGEVVETGSVERVFATPEASYTRALLDAVPRLDAVGLPPGAAPKGDPILRLDGISKTFRASGWGRRATVKALDDVSLDIVPGETLAVVGESGSGKSTLGRIAARLADADDGAVVIAGRDASRAGGASLRAVRAAVQMVFQDPYASLDPRRTAGQAIAEPMLIHKLCRRSEAAGRAGDLIERVGLSRVMLGRLPHEFSGGQRQRIAIARALAAEPRIIVADEPTSALDVSVQAQVLELLVDLQRERGLSMLFITHDLAVVRRIAHRIAVMRAGRVVELGSADDVLLRPAHPYARALIAAAPMPDPTRRKVARPAPDFGSNGPLVEVAPRHWAAL